MFYDGVIMKNVLLSLINSYSNSISKTKNSTYDHKIN